MNEELDILIHNGTVVDGSGKPSFRANIGILRDAIVSLEPDDEAEARINIDANGLTVCPGFIDIHSHSDMSILFDNRQVSMIRQGVTTSVVGNCGMSLAPVSESRIDMIIKEVDMFTPPGQEVDITWRTFSEYLQTLEKDGSTTNLVPLVGFGTVRIAGGPAYENRKPTNDELHDMKSLVAEAMGSGAFGLSSGLIYAPQVYADKQEIIALSKIVAKYNGLYFSHIRGEGEYITQAIQEFIDIVSESGCRGGQIAHHKIAGRPFWGTSKDTLSFIEKANKRGIKIACDQYPYNRGATSLITVLPPWVHEGGIDEIIKHLKDPDSQNRIRRDVETGLEGWENMVEEAGWSGIYISSVKTEKWKDIEGLSLTEIAKTRGYSDCFDLLFELLVDESGEVSMTIESMGEEDIRRIMTSKFTMIGTDGGGVSPEGVLGYGKPHPRYYGTYPRVLGKYVREEQLLTLEDAIWKMSGYPASQLGLQDRGLLMEGMIADIVIFDSTSIIDKATFTDPHQFPEGIHYVINNGVCVVDEGKQTGQLPGRILKHKP